MSLFNLVLTPVKKRALTVAEEKEYRNIVGFWRERVSRNKVEGRTSSDGGNGVRKCGSTHTMLVLENSCVGAFRVNRLDGIVESKLGCIYHAGSR